MSNFNVITIDYNLLDNKIHELEIQNTSSNYSTVILAAPDVVDIMKKDSIDFCFDECNDCAHAFKGKIYKYNGYRIFEDPSLCCGEIELR